MFVRTITEPRQTWEDWAERLRLHEDPPPGLVASVAWESGEDQVTSMQLWETPAAVADFYVARVHAIVEAEGAPENKPRQHGEPVAVYIRPT